MTKPGERHAETNWDKRTVVFSNECTWVEVADAFDAHRVDVTSIAVHEIGHVLGLRDSTDARSVMAAPDYNKLRIISRSPIPQVDIDTLKLVYPNEFSQFYASQGKTTWFEREGSKDFRFVHVSAGIDNTVWAIGQEKGPGGYVDPNPRNGYEFGPLDDYNKAWASRARGMTRLAVFSENLVLGQGTYDWAPRAADDFFDFKRYDPRTRSWANVSAGSFDSGSFSSGTKFGHVAVGPGGSVWAIAMRQKSRVQQIVRYDGDITLGTGDWQIVPYPDPYGYDDYPYPYSPVVFLDLAVGRRNGEPWIWVLPVLDPNKPPDGVWLGDNMESRPLDYFASNDLGKTWQQVPPITGYESIWEKTPKVYPSRSEKKRYFLVGKCVSVGDDGTAVRVFKEFAYRFDGSTWTQLPGQFTDVSVISKNNMWAVDLDGIIRSTIVKPL